MVEFQERKAVDGGKLPETEPAGQKEGGFRNDLADADLPKVDPQEANDVRREQSEKSDGVDATRRNLSQHDADRMKGN